jgi:hypothetical protein
MRQLRLILLILSVSLFLSFAGCSDFSRFTVSGSLVSQSIKELKDILEAFDFQSVLTSDVAWEFRETGVAYDSYLSIDSFNLTGTKVDLTKLRGTFNPSLEIDSDANPTITLIYEFKYTGRTSYTSKFVGTGKVTVSLLLKIRYLISALNSKKTKRVKIALTLHFFLDSMWPWK